MSDRITKEFTCAPIVASQFRDELNSKGWRCETTRVEERKFLFWTRKVAVTTASRPKR